MITIEFKNYDDMVAFARTLVRDLGEYEALKELVSCPGKYRTMLEGKPVQVATMAQPQATPAPQVSQVQPQQATPAPQVMAAPAAGPDSACAGYDPVRAGNSGPDFYAQLHPGRHFPGGNDTDGRRPAGRTY